MDVSKEGEGRVVRVYVNTGQIGSPGIVDRRCRTNAKNGKIPLNTGHMNTMPTSPIPALAFI